MSNPFRRAVDQYWVGKLNICFVQDPCCDLCPLLETYARKQCRITGEYLGDTRSCGYLCPLVISEQKTNAREMMDCE